MEQFDGRVAVITGGASGIGLATAKALAREGARIVLADRDEAALAAARPQVEELGATVLAVPTDVGELASVQALADRSFDHFGAVHVLFNNAGVAIAGLMHEHTHEEWEWVMRVNLWGVIHGVETFVPRLIAQGQGGHVVSTASFAGMVPNYGLGAYCVTKYGVVALSECLQRELRAEGIGVSVLCPMMVSTNIGANSARDRPGAVAEAAGMEAASTRPPEGRTLEVGAVADRVVDAIRRNELYILTHEESRDFIRRRFDRIDRSFEPPV
jgi:NAD(P)-dependent dehydrogenase (short-subunit alcohol dehydrogenase family)